MRATTLLLVVLCLVVISLAAKVKKLRIPNEREYSREFKTWATKHNKNYVKEELKARYQIFKQNYDLVNTFNFNPKNKFSVGTNIFADLTNSEFNTLYKGLKLNLTAPKGPHQVPFKRSNLRNVSCPANSGIGATCDWRQQTNPAVITPIKNQGQCGSCWSFSATGSSEAQHAFTAGTLVGLSEQNLIDCSTAQGNEGCNGGLMDQAFEYIISNNGIDTEASYPYTATGPNPCKFKVANIGATLVSYTDIPSKNENDLQAAIVAAGPVSVAIDASSITFQLYLFGVYYDPLCSSTQLDHGVLAVGVGTTTYDGEEYYIVKNSWGASWGMDGWIWMSRNADNNCGIATAASYPTA